MTAIVFYPKHNTPGKRDANEFRARARDFIDQHGGKAWGFDNRRSVPERKREVLGLLNISRRTEAETLAFFMHGWQTGCQCMRSADIPELAKVLTRFKDMHTICLFACSCAAGANNGEKSFAAKLRDATGMEVWAHSTKGHTTRNPNVVCFEDSYNGGYYPVPKGSRYWSKWVKKLKGGLWMDFPNLEPWKVLG